MLTKQSKDEALRQVAAHFQGKNVLITGGFGFVGSHLTKVLVGCGANVTVLDIRTDPSVASLLNDETLQLRRQIQVVQGDVGNASVVRAVMSAARYDFVFNFATHATATDEAVEHPYERVLANTIGLVNILEAERVLKSRPAMIFHAFTDSVNGDQNDEPSEVAETSRCGIGVYDGAKLAPDVVFARAHYQAFGIPTVILRICNLFGPCDFNMNQRLIPRAMRSLYGAPEPIRPELCFDAIDHWHEYLYIDDCIRAILLITENPASAGQVFNLTAAKCTSTPEMLKEIVQSAYEIEREFNKDRAENILKNGFSVKVPPSDAGALTPKKWHLTGDQVKRLTEFEPAVEFSAALSQTIRAYRSYFVAKGTLQL